MSKYSLFIAIALIIILISCIQDDHRIDVTSNQTFKQFEFEVIKGLRITTDGKYAYVLEPLESGYAINKVKIEDGKVISERIITMIEVARGPKVPMIIHIKGDGWNITLESPHGLRLSDIISFNNIIYVAGIEIVKVKDSKVRWIKEFMIDVFSYEGTRDNPKQVYYRINLDISEMESDGKYIYLNGGPIIKTDDNLNIIWAIHAGKIRDITVSDGIYAVKRNCIIKLDKNGEVEWVVTLKSDEKIKRNIPEEKRKAKADEIEGKEEFVEVMRYSVNIFTIYVEDCIYVAGIIEDIVSKAYPFIAKLSKSGDILWIKVLNSTYGSYVCIVGKILKCKNNYIVWIDKDILIFDENGRIIDYYEVNGVVSDIDIIDNKILLTSVEPERVKIEKKDDGLECIQINIKATKGLIETKRIDDKIKVVEHYSI